MADSTLAMTYADLKEAVGHYLGYSRTEGDWNTRQTANVEAAVKRGLREFYFQAQMPGERAPHKWSFLNPRNDLVVWPTATGTVSGQGTESGGITTLTASAGTFYPSMEKKTFKFDTSETEYEIYDYVSATSIKLVGDASSETNNDTFTITADGDYTLPENHQAIEGPFTFTTGSTPWYPLAITNESRIREMRSSNTAGGVPAYTAIDAIQYDPDDTHVQRYQVMVYPTPSGVYTLKYRNILAPDALDGDTEYPPGGVQFTECVRLMCEAAADAEVYPERQSAKYQPSRMALYAAIESDRANNAPETMGAMTDRGLLEEEMYQGDYLRAGVYVSVNGVIYP